MQLFLESLNAVLAQKASHDPSSAAINLMLAVGRFEVSTDACALATFPVLIDIRS